MKLLPKLNTVNDSHYVDELQFIDIIYNKFTLEEFIGFCKGNIHKYLFRYKYKGGIKDLEKAQTYLGWLIIAEKERRREREGRP